MNISQIHATDTNLETNLHALLPNIMNGASCVLHGSGETFATMGGDFAKTSRLIGSMELLKRDRLVLGSSGTTAGFSKLVVYDTNRFLKGMDEVTRRIGLASNRAAVSYVNPRFVYGLSIAVTHALANESVTFAATDTVPIDFAGKPLDIYMTPAQTLPFCVMDFDLSKASEVRFIFAGDKLTAKVAERLAAQYPHSRILNMYGQVELGPRVATRETWAKDFEEGNAGKPLDGVDVSLMCPDDAGFGSLTVRSDYQMLGYLKDEPFVSNDLTNKIDTGDIATITKGGEIVISGRSSKHVNLCGKRIDLSHIEKIASQSESVAIARARCDTNALSPRVKLTIQPIPHCEHALEATKTTLEREFGDLTSFIDIIVQDKTNPEGAGKL